ncbi:substrate-binding domain-containing protein [Candidatus Villigracilis saccharophilus]|uniref:substrate-binding domain-containing protein n=1 Tax=Candidatus Villigracilis saccharophilus TaxID=3140684 RepID=UPI0031EB592D
MKVGLISDATGALAIYGAHILRSFMLGMEYATGAAGSAGEKFDITAVQENTFKIDDCEIIVYVRDDGSNPENTATVARELIDVQKVNVLIGTVSSGATATLQGIALESKIPLIVAPAAANDITGVNFNEYTFRVSRNNYQDAINECAYLTKTYKTFVQIAPDYAFGRGSAAAFRDACTLDGATFVADDIFAPLDTADFTTYMEQIANSGAESYIVSWAGGGFVPLMQSAKDQGVTETMALGATFIDNTLMPVWYGNAVGSTSGILYHYSAPKNPINDFLVENTKPRYGVNPDLFDADGMNAAILLVEAIKATAGDVNGDALKGVMEGMTFEGPKGTIYIRPEDHVAIQDMYILKLVNVTDPDANFYEYVDTTRPEPPCLLPEALKDRCGTLPYGTLSGQ